MIYYSIVEMKRIGEIRVIGEIGEIWGRGDRRIRRIRGKRGAGRRGRKKMMKSMKVNICNFCNFNKRINVDVCSFCRSGGLSLEEQPLVNRLLAVVIKPKIVVKKNLAEEKKRQLVSSAVSHLLNCPDCRLAIFWHGQKQWLHL